jgi:hypothetical protein
MGGGEVYGRDGGKQFCRYGFAFTPAFGRAGDVLCARFERPKAKALGYLEAKTTAKAKGKCKSDNAVVRSFEEEVAFAGVAG